MAKPYPFVPELASRLARSRERKALSYEKLGRLADVDAAHAYRICRGRFRTLNPSVLKICSVLDVKPKEDSPAALRPTGDHPIEAMLSAEVLAAWDRTEEGARLLTRILRAFQASP